jgi:hypothetical protein
MEKKIIEIIGGHDPSSYFWIRPTRYNNKNKHDYWENFDCYKELEISIEDGNVDCFLSYFLFKYFDGNYKYNLLRNGCSGFEWYLEHNFFSFDSIEAMLKDIEDKIGLLKNDYNNPKLNELKDKFSIYYVMDNVPRDFDFKDEQMVIGQNVDVIIDFYNRLIMIMRNMISEGKSNGYEMISVMGP